MAQPEGVYPWGKTAAVRSEPVWRKIPRRRTRHSPPEGIVHDPLKRPLGCPGPLPEGGGDVIVQGEGRAHANIIPPHHCAVKIAGTPAWSASQRPVTPPAQCLTAPACIPGPTTQAATRRRITFLIVPWTRLHNRENYVRGPLCVVKNGLSGDRHLGVHPELVPGVGVSVELREVGACDLDGGCGVQA